MRRGALVIALVIGCGAPARAPDARDPLAKASPGGAAAERAEGAPRACTHDVEDLAPCAEECDRAIAFSCTVLAARVERGDRVPRDLTRAVRIHERACELRDAASCVNAARMYASGAGVPPSRAKQIELLGAACMLGDAFACAVPAKAFASGNGVARDPRRAEELWQHACAGGVESACASLGEP
ncbi:MAG: sel1 repeat family protein [Labilithrix sp.]|nr:sel1 repeat family protein [Labilithrix sp.]